MTAPAAERPLAAAKANVASRTPNIDLARTNVARSSGCLLVRTRFPPGSLARIPGFGLLGRMAHLHPVLISCHIPPARRHSPEGRSRARCRAASAGARHVRTCVLSSGSPVACLVSASVTAQPPLCARAASSTRPAWRATLSSAGKGGSCDEGSREGAAWALESEARETEPNARPARPAAAAAASRAALAPRRRAIDDIDPEGQN